MADEEETKMDFILKGSFSIQIIREAHSIIKSFFQSLTETNQRDTKAA